VDELSPSARALLAAAYGVDDPLPSDLDRVRRAVLLRIGATGLGAALFSLSLQRAQTFIGLAAPKLVTVVLLAVGGRAIYQHTQRHTGEAVNVTVGRAEQARWLAPLATLSVPPSVDGASSPDSASSLASEPVAPTPRPQRSARVTSAPAAAASSAGLEAEMRWVRGADAALRAGNTSAARALLDQHAREFPNGSLAEEREGLRVVAGCQGAASADGTRAAARFLARAPSSLLAGRVRAACLQLAGSSGG
jgi:hypothetical protein